MKNLLTGLALLLGSLGAFPLRAQIDGSGGIATKYGGATETTSSYAMKSQSVNEEKIYKADENLITMATPTESEVDVQFLTEFVLWGDEKIIVLLKKLSNEEFNRSFGELVGSVQSKTAHILSIYDFFVAILEGKAHDKFPDLSHLSQEELIAKWEHFLVHWPKLVASIDQERLFALPPAKGQRVEAKHIFLDAVLHSSHHRGQILSFLRLLGKTKGDMHPDETNLDYFRFVFTKHQELVHPPANK